MQNLCKNKEAEPWPPKMGSLYEGSLPALFIALASGIYSEQHAAVAYYIFVDTSY